LITGRCSEECSRGIDMKLEVAGRNGRSLKKEIGEAMAVAHKRAEMT